MCLGIFPPKRSILKWWNNPLARRKYENALYMYERMKHFFTEKIPCVRSKIYYIIQAPLNLRPRNITFGEENYINLWLQEHSYERPCVSNCFAFFFFYNRYDFRPFVSLNRNVCILKEGFSLGYFLCTTMGSRSLPSVRVWKGTSAFFFFE